MVTPQGVIGQLVQPLTGRAQTPQLREPTIPDTRPDERRPAPSRSMHVATVQLVTANKEYPYRFPVGCQRFTIHARTAVDVRMSTTPGAVREIGPQMFTIKAGSAFCEDDLNMVDQQAYFASGTAGVVVEIVFWR